MEALHTLTSMLELCFGDVGEEEGLAELRDQLEVYPGRRAPFLAGLDAVIARSDPAECRAILEEWAHFTAHDDGEAVAWFRWVRDSLQDGDP